MQRIVTGHAPLPSHVKVRWHGADSDDEALAAMGDWAQFLADQKPEAWLISLGEEDAFHARYNYLLESRGIPFLTVHASALDSFETDKPLSGIVCACRSKRVATAVAGQLAVHPLLSSVPFEQAVILEKESDSFERLDEYRETGFVSPSLLDEPSPYDIYEESLQHCEQKCGLRDFLDLYQLLRHVVQRNIPGDIAEFGSYRGHSGWLIARTLQALDSDKRLFMFDTFESFPQEQLGVDHFWNASHYVDFEAVGSLMSGFSNVQLVKGDFTQTLKQTPLANIALAYIDCDSYRATRYLIDQIWDRHLPDGAVLACEDYGHPALLGNRAAVHASLDSRRDSFCYFSQFSGFYIAVKLAST